MLIHNGIHVILILVIPGYILGETLLAVGEGNGCSALQIARQELPAFLISTVICLGTCCGNNSKRIARIIFLHVLIDGSLEGFEACEELRSPVFVTYTQVVQTKRCLVAHLLTESRPLVVFKIGTDGKID